MSINFEFLKRRGQRPFGSPEPIVLGALSAKWVQIAFTQGTMVEGGPTMNIKATLQFGDTNIHSVDRVVKDESDRVFEMRALRVLFTLMNNISSMVANECVRQPPFAFLHDFGYRGPALTADIPLTSRRWADWPLSPTPGAKAIGAVKMDEDVTFRARIAPRVKDLFIDGKPVPSETPLGVPKEGPAMRLEINDGKSAAKAAPDPYSTVRCEKHRRDYVVKEGCPFC